MCNVTAVTAPAQWLHSKPTGTACTICLLLDMYQLINSSYRSKCAQAQHPNTSSPSLSRQQLQRLRAVSATHPLLVCFYCQATHPPPLLPSNNPTQPSDAPKQHDSRCVWINKCISHTPALGCYTSPGPLLMRQERDLTHMCLAFPAMPCVHHATQHN